MAFRSKYDTTREADLNKRSARGKSIARRGKDIKEFRKSLPPFPNPEFLRYKQKEYTYSPRWRDVDSEQLRKKIPDSDAKSGFLAGLRKDTGQMWRDVAGGPGEDLGTMIKDVIVNPTKKYMPAMLGALQRGLGHFGNNWTQNVENERILGDDLHTDKIKQTMVPGWDLRPGDPGYEGSTRQDFDQYSELARLEDDTDKKQQYLDVARSSFRNADVTRRLNYALGQEPFGFDTSAEAGVAAYGETPDEFKRRIDYGALSGNLLKGLEGTKGGREFLSNVIPKGEALEDTGMIGNAAARIARAQAEGRAGFATPKMRQAAVFEAELPEAVSIETIPEEGWDEQFLFPPRSALSMQGQNFGRGKAPRSPEESELLMDLYTDPFHGDPYYRQGHIPTIDEIAGTGYTDYRGVNPFREPYLPMEGPSPVPLPPYLSENTDWFTPEPEARGLIPRGVEGLVEDQYGVDTPGIPRERKLPNTPFPGYEPPPSWYQKYLDQFGLNTGYDYYNE